MRNADQEVLVAAHDWIVQGHDVILVTVARTWGSAPRPVGSIMAMRQDGQVVGSVSGGCIEDDLLQRMRAGALDLGLPQFVRYGAGGEDHRRFSIPCDGRLELVLESLHGVEPLRAILDAIQSRRRIARRLCLNTGEVSLHPALPDQQFGCDDNALSKVYGPAWRLLIIGAGQASGFLADMALALDYHVIVCDPRAEYQASWKVNAVEVEGCMPDDAVRAWASDCNSAVVALTHDPRLDDLALMEALTADTFYVGALGSKANNDRRRARLAALGLTEAQVGRLRGPVGLGIGSRTPAEIAISILAHLTALRNGVHVEVVCTPESARADANTNTRPARCLS